MLLEVNPSSTFCSEDTPPFPGSYSMTSVNVYMNLCEAERKIESESSENCNYSDNGFIFIFLMINKNLYLQLYLHKKNKKSCINTLISWVYLEKKNNNETIFFLHLTAHVRLWSLFLSYIVVKVLVLGAWSATEDPQLGSTLFLPCDFSFLNGYNSHVICF